MSTELGAEGEDVKPKLNLTIVLGDQNAMVKVKVNQSFIKVFQAAEKKFNKEPGTLKFTYDGKRILKDDTPGGLEMEDGDQIDAHLEQVGGGYV